MMMLAVAGIARAEEAEGGAEAPEGYRASVAILVDASQAMAATTGGRSMLAQTLAAVGEAIEKRPPAGASELSLRLVGGATPKDPARCEDSRLLVPAGVSAGPVLQAGLPEARGPRALAAALEAAAGSLPRDAQRALVLVTSGGDACGEDPCAVVSELRKTLGLGQVRVVLVGREAGARKRLECVGPVAIAKDAADTRRLVQAALSEAFEPARVTVLATERGATVPADVELYAQGDQEPAARGRTGEPIAVPGGTWHVAAIARAKGAQREGWRRDVLLAPASQVTVRVALGTEAATLVAQVRLNGEPAPEGTRLYLHQPGEDSEFVASGWPGEPIAAAPGTYDVRAEIPGSALGPIEVWKPEVNLPPGRTTQLSLDAVQRMGTITVEVTSAGQPVEDAVVVLLPNGSREQGDAAFEVGEERPAPSGTYTVAVRLETAIGPLEVHRDGVKIGGEPVRLHVELPPTGFLRIEVEGASEEDLITVGLVRPKEATPAGFIEAFAPYRLPAGRWDLRIEQPLVPGVRIPRIWWERGVVVAPGETKNVIVKRR